MRQGSHHCPGPALAAGRRNRPRRIASPAPPGRLGRESRGPAGCPGARPLGHVSQVRGGRRGRRGHVADQAQDTSPRPRLDRRRLPLKPCEPRAPTRAICAAEQSRRLRLPRRALACTATRLAAEARSPAGPVCQRARQIPGLPLIASLRHAAGLHRVSAPSRHVG